MKPTKDDIYAILSGIMLVFIIYVGFNLSQIIH